MAHPSRRLPPRTRQRLNEAYLSILRAAGLRGAAHYTRNGVPTLRVKAHGVTYSVVYFAKAQHYKVYFTLGSGGGRQQVRTFREANELGAWFQGRSEAQQATGQG